MSRVTFQYYVKLRLS